MAQWGQGQQGFQYPMQTGFPGQNPQFQQQNPQFQAQNPQFQQQQPQFQQQNPQFQQGGFGQINNGGMVPQPTGFPGQRPQNFQQPQQTGFQGGTGFIQQQPTGFGGNFQQQQPRPPPVPPVPQIPTQFQQQHQAGNFLSLPPPQQQPNRFLSPSPAMGGPGLAAQPTGFAGRPSMGPLVPQMTGFVDPRLQMMSSTFMPLNMSAPYSAGGAPQLAPQQNLQQSIQQHNEEQRGTANQHLPWALTKQEQKNYNNIFRSWDAQNTGFINGSTALEVFGQSGLAKDDLARIWTLADIDDRGKLNRAEFHVAMGLIYRRLNGMPIPDQLPQELVPPSARDLDKSVDIVKDLLKHETRNRSPSSFDTPVSRLKNRSFNSSSSSLESGRDATIYKHSDSEPPGGFYKPRSRHIDRDAVRSSNDDDSPAADLSDMKRQLANTAQMLDRAADDDAARTAEDEELDREMDDLKYRVKRVQDDLDYVSRGPKTHSKDEERRRLERELLSLLHERVPEVERKIKARDERKEREKRQWARDRDRANERFGRFDTKDDSYSPRRFDDRDRPYSRGYDRGERDDRSYRSDSRNDRDRDRDRERDYERTRSPPRARSPPPLPPTAPASLIRDPPAAPPPPKATASPAPTKNMTAEERQAFARAEAQRRIQARMAALGVTAPSSALDTSVEDRLQQEKKEAEEKAKAAEKQAEERERSRKERLENEKAAKDVRTTPAPPTPTPTATATVPTPTAPPTAPTPRFVPPATKTRAPAPPPPRKSAMAPPRVVATPPAPKPPAPPAAPAVDPEEERLRAREEAIRKQREERAARLRQLEKEEEEAARLEEERYQARVQALKAKAAKSPSPPPAPAPVPPTPPPAPASVVAAPDKSTNPFSRLLKESGVTPPAASNPTSPSNGTSNPWAKSVPIIAPPPSKSPVPTAVKTSYHTAPSEPDDDWNDIMENPDDDDSSDDEITKSRATRANIAQQLFGSILPRSTSAAGQGSTPATPSNAASPPPPPPPAPPAPAAPPPPAAPPAPIAAPRAAPAVGDVSALMQSIQGGMRLKPTKTVDKSAPPVSGRVLGDTAPPSHINASPRPVSPPQMALPQTIPMSSESTSHSNNRQSVDWFSNRAADAGALPVERLASTAEDSEGEVYETPSDIPEIHINETSMAPESDLMADINKSIENRVRTLYAFEGDGPDDLSFGENIVLQANPLKSGGEWWFGTNVSNGKSGLFPKAYVEVFKPKKAKAVYTSTGNNPNELLFTKGDILSIVDSNEEEWWTAEQRGLIFIVPAAYLEIVEVPDHQIILQPTSTERSSSANPQVPATGPPSSVDPPTTQRIVDSDAGDDESDSDYLSFNESDDEQEGLNSPQEREAREHERQLVLEAAGLIVQKNVGPPPAKLTRNRSIHVTRRPAPAAPQRISVVSSTSSTSTSASYSKRLPSVPEPEHIDHAQQLDDAFARYESFRNNQGNLNRLSVLSTDSSITSTVPSSPTTTTSASSFAPSHTQTHEGRYSQFLNSFLGRNKTPDGERRSTLQISAPIINHSGSSGGTPDDGPSRSGTPFGASWASLVDKTALEGIPLNERKRQEAIFELINTEVAYVRDLQLIVELFYRSLLPLLSEKEVTVIFANIEDLLLTNTGFVSSLEERQKECRLYIDRIGDLLKVHVPNMGVYMEYCVNQSTAIKVLQSLRESNPELASHLQRLRDEPTARNLDLSSYLLAPMQRITRYPLLLKQILHYTETGEERHTIELAITTSEHLLNHINEAIRDQEGRETLKRISQNLWIGQGRLDLSAPTRYMGSRRLLKEGVLVKAKSGRKLFGFLCSDILVLTDESVKTLYRMPIPLAHAQVKDILSGKDDLAFQVAQAYPRGGDTIILRASSVRDCQLWIQEIERAIRKARHAEERTIRKGGRR